LSIFYQKKAPAPARCRGFLEIPPSRFSSEPRNLTGLYYDSGLMSTLWDNINRLGPK